jgi:hypothetical protein
MAHVDEDLPGLSDLFGVDPEECPRRGSGVLDNVIEPLLGYDRNEVGFEYPSHP